MNTQQQIKQTKKKIQDMNDKIVFYKSSIQDKQISIKEIYKSIQDFTVSSQAATEGIYSIGLIKTEISKIIGQINRSKNRVKDYEMDLQRLNNRLDK